MIDRTIKVLLLEDLSTDQVLLKRHILKKLPNALLTIADSKDSFLKRLNWATYDIILSDYNLPGYNGLEAMLAVKEHMPHVPFVFVTGTLNDEEKVAHTILSGAAGYVLKQNMDVLADRMIEIIEESQKANEARRVRQEKEMEQARLLQKLEAKVSGVSDSNLKDELKTLIAEFNMV